MKVMDNDQAQIVNGAIKETTAPVFHLDWTKLLNPPIALPEPVAPVQSAMS